MICLLIYVNDIWLENIIGCAKCPQLTRHHFSSDWLTDVSVTVSIYRNVNDFSIWSDTVMDRIVITKENMHLYLKMTYIRCTPTDQLQPTQWNHYRNRTYRTFLAFDSAIHYRTFLVITPLPRSVQSWCCGAC